jgi:hippurate hydrolase
MYGDLHFGREEDAGVAMNAHIAPGRRRLAELRQDIHRHPELGFEERRTAALVVAELRAAGAEDIHEGVGGTGVVALIRKGGSARSIAIRADMDALPLSDLKQTGHRSDNPDVMHGCGHDGHTAILIGTARALANDAAFDGTVTLVFQPAEEGLGGAMAMIEDGLFERFPVDQIYALHNWPGLSLGKVAIKSGAMMSAVDRFDITILGKGGHAAQPHLTIDPVPVAAQLVGALQTIVSRSTDPTDASVLSVTRIQAGSAYNIIPDSAEIHGTVRTISPQTRERVERQLHLIATSIAAAAGARCEIVYHRGTPATINSDVETGLLRLAAQEALGADNVEDLTAPSLAGEDFACFLERRPGAFIRLGNGVDSHGLHSPHYDFNDDAIDVGVRLWTALVQRVLPVLG